MIHAIYQIIGDMTGQIRKKALPHIGIHEGSFFHRALQRIFTFVLVTIAWIFFRTGVKGALRYVWGICTSWKIGEMIEGRLWDVGLSPFGWILLGIGILIMLFADHVLYEKKMRIDEAVNGQGPLAKGMVVIIMSLAILILGIYGDQHDASYFVYRDF